MTQPAPAPATPAPSAHTDGMSRAVRSWVGGAIATGLAYGGAGLLTAAGAIRWDSMYWKALGLQAVGVLLYGAVAYTMRRTNPPQQ